MEVDLDIDPLRLPPWELVFVVNGVRHATREPSMEEQRIMCNLSGRDFADCMTLYLSFFVEPRPDRSRFTVGQLLHFSNNLIGYLFSRQHIAAVLSTASATAPAPPPPADVPASHPLMN